MHRTMLNNGARFETYAIAGELQNYSPRAVHVGANNQIVTVDHEVATLSGASTEPVPVA